MFLIFSPVMTDNLYSGSDWKLIQNFWNLKYIRSIKIFQLKMFLIVHRNVLELSGRIKSNSVLGYLVSTRLNLNVLCAIFISCKMVHIACASCTTVRLACRIFLTVGQFICFFQVYTKLFCYDFIKMLWGIFSYQFWFVSHK